MLGSFAKWRDTGFPQYPIDPTGEFVMDDKLTPAGFGACFRCFLGKFYHHWGLLSKRVLTDAGSRHIYY